MPIENNNSITQDDNVSDQFEMTCPRLNVWQSGMLISSCCLVFWVTPAIWRRAEPFRPDANFRMPYDLSNDYGLYRRLVEDAVRNDSIVMLGDSVIWGEYTKPSGTLAQCLHADFPDQGFTNGGLNGLHPIAMEGLVRHYAGALSNQKVLAHCNLLWLSSKERDLSSPQEQSFNHEQLVPQFDGAWPFLNSSVPSYQGPISARLTISIERELKFRDVVQHVRRVYFNGRDLHSWSIDHPYENPIGPIKLETLEPANKLRHKERDWRENGLKPTQFDWVILDESRQWRAFLLLLDLLEIRGNHVLVLVGPFNSHMLKPESLRRFQELRHGVVDSLAERKVVYFAPEPLSSQLYGDASHPLAAGYRELAAQMSESNAVRNWLDR